MLLIYRIYGGVAADMGGNARFVQIIEGNLAILAILL